MMIGLLYRTIPHEHWLNLHPAMTTALPREGALAPGPSEPKIHLCVAFVCFHDYSNPLTTSC